MIQSEKKRIVVIEDDPYFLDMLKIRLNLSGYKVITAIDGLRGLRIVRIVKPDLVILDLRMPGLMVSKESGSKYIDEQMGQKICRMIKYDEKLRHIPVLMLTNSDSFDDIEKSMSSGVNAYLMKTTSMEFMTQEVDRLLGVRREQPAALAVN